MDGRCRVHSLIAQTLRQNTTGTRLLERSDYDVVSLREQKAWPLISEAASAKTSRSNLMEQYTNGLVAESALRPSESSSLQYAVRTSFPVRYVRRPSWLAGCHSVAAEVAVKLLSIHRDL